MGNQILKQNNNNEYGNGERKNKIKLNDGNDTSGNIRDINITFFSVWRNKLIRNEILFHTRLFNIHLGRRISLKMEDLPKYKYKSYLDKVVIYEEQGIVERYYFGEGDSEMQLLLPNVIPYNVSEVSFDCKNLIIQDNSIPNTVTSVRFIGNPIKQEFTKGILPDSITHLDFGYNSLFNQSLSGGWLPSSLKSLLLPREFQCDIGVNQLPESLTELNFKSYFFHKGKIEPGSIPSTTRPLDYTWKCECEKELTNQESSNVSISNIEYGFSKCIKEGDIPDNAISITFSDLFNGKIQGTLPASLKSLKFICFPSVTIGENVLSSSNLTSIDMGDYHLPLVSNLFPQSITSIIFYMFNQPIPEGYFYNYTNLKSLEFRSFNQIIPDKTLPPSLESLKFGNFNQVIPELPPSLTLLELGLSFNQVIPENTFPSSLTSLDLGRSFNKHSTEKILPKSLTSLTVSHSGGRPLNVSALPASLSTLEIKSPFNLGIGLILPSSITSLSLGIQDPVPVGVLPHNLKVLYINTPNFNHDLDDEGILPKSIQSVYLHCKIDINYINYLDFDFFKKYIRFK